MTMYTVYRVPRLGTAQVIQENLSYQDALVLFLTYASDANKGYTVQAISTNHEVIAIVYPPHQSDQAEKVFTEAKLRDAKDYERPPKVDDSIYRQR